MLRTAHAAQPLDPAHPGHAPPRPGGAPLPLLVAIAAAGLACGGDGPTEPPRPRDDTCPTAPVPLCTAANAAAAAAARDAGSDALGRATPALENSAAKAALTASLNQLQGALAGGNVTQARAAMQSAREALAAAGGQLASFPGDAADLAAIELALDQVAPLLGGS